MKNNRPSTASRVIQRIFNQPGGIPDRELGILMERYNKTISEIGDSEVLHKICITQAMMAVQEITAMKDSERNAANVGTIIAAKIIPALGIGAIIGREIEKGEMAESRIITTGQWSSSTEFDKDTG